MAIVVLTDAYVLLNGVNLSDHVESVEISMDADDVDVTAMGAVSHAHAPGLRNDSYKFKLFQDFAAAKVDATLSPLLGVAAGFSVEVRPTSGARSATNPAYTATGILLSYQPLAGKVGDASQTDVSIMTTGAGIARQIA